jgi:uncharacterized protein (DUF1810 family)
MKNIERFKLAQEEFGDYEIALSEIKNGKKLTHWIWFVFPQLEFLCQSEISRYYGIEDIEEARAFLADYILDSRLRKITSELLKHKGKDIKSIFGYPDYMKVKSCMTLFDYISPQDIFADVLTAFYNSGRCLATLAAIKRSERK